MKKKSLFTLLLVLAFTFVILTPSAHAGNVQRHRWEGLAIGLGTVILGSALLRSQQLPTHQSFSYDSQPPPSYRHRPDRDDRSSWRHKRSHRHHRGYWEMRKEWVPPTYKKVWNPGHYNRHRKWVAGHWIRIEGQPGYWTKTRVWVARGGDRH